MKCPNCSFSVSPKQVYCPSCGVVIAAHEVFQVGAEALERYTISAAPNAGDVAGLYRATDGLMEREVTLRVVATPPDLSETEVQRWIRRARSALDLFHENVPKFVDLEPIEGADAVCVVYEPVAGRALSRLIAEHREADRRIDWDTARSIIGGIIDALEYAHIRGAAHLGLRPANILIDVAGATLRALLLDFGLARLPGGETLSDPRDLVYHAPERLDPATEADARADIYSVGAIFHELLTLRAPLGAFEMPGSIRADLPIGFDDWLKRALAPDPDRRFQRVEQLASMTRTSGRRDSLIDEPRLEPTVLKPLVEPEPEPEPAPTPEPEPVEEVEPEPIEEPEEDEVIEAEIVAEEPPPSKPSKDRNAEKIEKYINRTLNALSENQYKAAQDALNALGSVDPNHPRLEDLRRIVNMQRVMDETITEQATRQVGAATPNFPGDDKTPLNKVSNNPAVVWLLGVWGVVAICCGSYGGDWFCPVMTVLTIVLIGIYGAIKDDVD